MTAGLAEYTRNLMTKRLILPALYIVAISALAVHLYHTPVYAMDVAQYVGNAILMEQTDPVQVHQRVYAEIDRYVPAAARETLLGREEGAPEEQNKSREIRAKDPYTFMEFLPFFAIRPLYNQAIYLLGKTGMGLIPASVLISAISYVLMGILLLVWVSRYLHSQALACLMALLVMISYPFTLAGRTTGSDGLATVVAFFALYLISETKALTAGLALLLVSIYIRTDNVVLAGLVIAMCWLQHRVDLPKAAVLAALALGSALAINHFAGDYGIKMLYYRNFFGTPIEPAAMVVRLSFHDYLAAVRKGLMLGGEGFFAPFLLLGVGGVLFSKRIRALLIVTTAYVAGHFMVLPNWQERWFLIFYLSMCVAASAVVGALQSRGEISANAVEATSGA